ncbi:MAG: hypothetical protein GWP35_02480, partial [Proteobacteria bacterium]|nr:hypothetical protein [Pseudomonadota bacterium]
MFFRLLCTFLGVLWVVETLPAQGIGGEDCGSAGVIGAIPFFDTGDTCGAWDDYNESCPFTPT